MSSSFFYGAVAVLVSCVISSYAEMERLSNGALEQPCQTRVYCQILGAGSPLASADTRAGTDTKLSMSQMTLVGIEVAVLAVMVALAGIVITYVCNVRNALKTAVEPEAAKVLRDLKEHYDAKFSAYDQKVSTSASLAYISAMQAIQAFFACANGGTTGVYPDNLRIAWEKLMITGSRLQIQYGDNEEVIAGANNVYQLAPKIVAMDAITEGLNRNDISGEARTTLRSRFEELGHQLIQAPLGD